jgi:hypothetical protein
LICNRSIKGLAVAQQFYSGAWRSRASDNCITCSPNERNLEGWMARPIASGQLPLPGATKSQATLKASPGVIWCDHVTSAFGGADHG